MNDLLLPFESVTSIDSNLGKS